MYKRRSLCDRLFAAFHFIGYWTVKICRKNNLQNFSTTIFKNRVEVLSYRKTTNRKTPIPFFKIIFT